MSKKQTWWPHRCACCGARTAAHVTRPGAPIELRAHFVPDGDELCTCEVADELVPPCARQGADGRTPLITWSSSLSSPQATLLGAQ